MTASNAHQEMTRVTRSKTSARQFYDRISGFYDLMAASSEKKYTDTGLQQLAIQEGEYVLEIGFGTGQALVEAAGSIGDDGCVYGIDISSGMCRVASRRIRDSGLSHRIALCLGDAQSLPYKDDRFDALFTSFTLELFDTPHIPIVLAECRRVLKHQGRLCVVALSRDKGLGTVGQLYEWLHNRFPTYLDCRPIPVESILKHTGFRIIDTQQYSMWGLPVSITLADQGD